MKVLITGASGMIGTALTSALESAGHSVEALERGGPRPGVRTWDIPAGRIDDDALDGIDAVVHLAGAPIGPWLTASKKRDILESRVQGTGLIARAVADAGTPVLISGSAIGYYGDAGDTELTEESPRGAGFLADVVAAWEDAAGPAVDSDTRVVFIRTGLVMDGDDGLLGRIMLPFRLGLGGPIGSGRQWWSWITLRDEVRAIVHCLEHDSLSGPVNLVAPEPLRNREFVRALGEAIGRPTVIPLPAFALKAIVGPEFAEEAVLASQRVLPTALASSGFTYADPEPVPALESVT